MRAVVVALAVAFVALLAFLTFFVLFTSGLDLLVMISLLVLAVCGFGILGALTRPPEDP
jgi:hypothetical protein